jgi:arylsulfatase A-like enzyme
MRIEHEGISKLIQDNVEYASMIAAMDEGVGEILNKIKELGIDDNTYIFFTSDNGGLSTLKNRGYPTSNLPLRAGKGWCYEGGIRVPMIMTGPDIKHGKTNELAISMDLYPSILTIAEIPLIPDQHSDGRNLYNLKPGDNPTLYFHYPHYHGSTWTPGAALRKDNWKLIEFYDYEKVELYNLANDLSETENLADSLPDLKNELLDQLHTWQTEIGAQFPRPNTGNLRPKTVDQRPKTVDQRPEN